MTININYSQSHITSDEGILVAEGWVGNGKGKNNPAKGVILWFLDRVDRDAVTLPPFGIYIRPEFMGDLKLRRHEAVHWDQYRRMGAIKFYIVYLLGMVRYGYWEHPMEIEAREKS